MDQGEILYKNLRLTDALKKYRRIATGYHAELTTQAMYKIGKTYFRQRKYTRAISEFKKIKNCFSLSTSSGLCSPFRNASEKRFSVSVDSVAIKIVFKDKMRFILLVRRHPEQNL